MTFLLTIALSTPLAAGTPAPAGPIALAFEPDSSSVAFTAPDLSLEDRFALLMGEHRLSVRITSIAEESRHAPARTASLP